MRVRRTTRRPSRYLCESVSNQGYPTVVISSLVLDPEVRDLVLESSRAFGSFSRPQVPENAP